ncbi:DUF29 family protein [Desulfonema magnum]|uniref:DUF29 n=1 Tax=Desulfonema magnum TaxID=45655 RepID=A0A975GPJ5_9BACT|nr:DUF29 family protein [Desulfonema magnum]QTA88860.1 DUF29 [Desulfonema magnum]
MNNLAAVYDQDFYLWLCQNTELLREGRIEEIDIENIAEELDAMGNKHSRGDRYVKKTLSDYYRTG